MNAGQAGPAQNRPTLAPCLRQLLKVAGPLNGDAPFHADRRRATVLMYRKSSFGCFTLLPGNVFQMITDPDLRDDRLLVHLLNVSFNIGVELSRSG